MYEYDLLRLGMCTNVPSERILGAKVHVCNDKGTWGLCYSCVCIPGRKDCYIQFLLPGIECCVCVYNVHFLLGTLEP